MRRVLCVGLGNPGTQYAHSRHNAGWLVVDALIEKLSDPSLAQSWKREKNVESEVFRLQALGVEWIFLKPQTFMNDSGRAVASACKWYLNRDPATPTSAPYKDLIVFHDDLDLESGRHKLQFDSGPKIHNGINSIRQHLNSNAFWTVRIGVDNRQGKRDMPGHAYVLQNLPPEELYHLQQLGRLLAEELPYTVLQ